ncbi:MAG TPA: universal stress protein [Flavitalea sp.]|nr:universal stress protein [Flavitalea sp.]
MKKILIALDYNPSAQKIAEAGHALSKALGAEVCLTHVIGDTAYYAMEYSPIMGYGGFNPVGAFNQAEDLKDEAAKFLAAAVDHLKGENIQTAVLEGQPSDAILEYASSWKADLIVMGSQNHSGLEKLIMGDVTASVLKRSRIPMLIIPIGREGKE